MPNTLQLKPTNQKKWIIVIAILSLIILTLSATSIYFYKKTQDQNTQNNQPTTKEIQNKNGVEPISNDKTNSSVNNDNNDIKKSDLPENIYFTGQIINREAQNDNGLKVSGSLNIKGDEVSGVYVYDKNSEPIKLTGKMTKNQDSKNETSLDYKAKLLEENLNGEKTGIWNLEFSFNKDAGLSSDSNNLMEYIDLFYAFNSTWQKDENSKPLNLNLDNSINKIVLPEFNKKSNRLKISTKIHEIRTSEYWIYYKYPEFFGLTDQKTQDKINAEIKKYADVNKVEEVFKNQTKVDLTNDFECNNYSDSLDFDVKYNQNGLLSIIFTGYWYGCGTHGSHTFKTLNFDLKNDATLSLGDIFKSDSKYLEHISKLAKQELSKQQFTEEDLINDGYKPIPENFENWVFTKDGLEITFNDYQLGAYALGNPTTNISYKDLKDFMQPEIYNKLILK